MNDVEKFYYHLEIIPYLELGITFDPGPLLSEIERYKEQFSLHRPTDQDALLEGSWKTFQLQKKDSEKSEETMLLRNGPLQTHFPKTLEFLDLCVHTDQAIDIRYMMMEPHSRILPHQDSPYKTPMYTFHAAITYPADCHFYVGLDKNGNQTPFTREVPFAPGKVFLINASKYHSIVNESDASRIHLAALAVPKLPMSEMVKLAERQNGEWTEKELIKRFAKSQIAST